MENPIKVKPVTAPQLTPEPPAKERSERDASEFLSDYSDCDLTYADGTLNRQAVVELLADFQAKVEAAPQGVGHKVTCNSGLAKYPNGVPEGINADRNCDCGVGKLSPEPQLKWTDDALYDAYLRGCEDNCVPEPLSKETFLASWEDCADVN